MYADALAPDCATASSMYSVDLYWSVNIIYYGKPLISGSISKVNDTVGYSMKPNKSLHNNYNMDQVTKVGLSCYLFLLLFDSKTR